MNQPTNREPTDLNKEESYCFVTDEHPDNGMVWVEVHTTDADNPDIAEFSQSEFPETIRAKILSGCIFKVTTVYPEGSSITQYEIMTAEPVSSDKRESALMEARNLLAHYLRITSASTDTE